MWGEKREGKKKGKKEFSSFPIRKFNNRFLSLQFFDPDTEYSRIPSIWHSQDQMEARLSNILNS